MQQQIKFCTTPDNVRIAYSSVGSGPPLVKAANWMNHLEYDWTSPVWRHLMSEFAGDQQLIRYDERGTGLSDRRVEEFSLDAFVSDLESVIDAVGVERFPLLGISQGGAVAVSYAIKHPEKVSHLILHGTFATGWKRIPGLPKAIVERRNAEVMLIRHSWGLNNPAARQFWTTLCIPDGTPEEAQSFNEIQQLSVSAETAARIYEAIGDFDVAELLPELDLPVLVLHSRGDATVSYEDGRRMASMIRGARFVTLESKNHLLMEDEPSWPKFVSEVRTFLGRERQSDAADTPTVLFKICPACSRIYTDNSMLYCLDDGTQLANRADLSDPDPKTLILKD